MNLTDILSWLLDFLNITFSVDEVAFSGTFYELYKMSSDLMHSVLDFLNTLFYEYTFTFGTFDISFSMYNLIVFNVGMVILVLVLIKIMLEVLDIVL